MRVHAIVDFMHIYYKYFFQVQEGKLKRLSAVVNNNGVDEEVDTTLIYYPLRDIEGIRKGLEQLGHEVVISVCFDMPSKRKESDNDYKSGRVHRLGDSDHHNLDVIEELLSKAGHNTYRLDGYEADDIVNYLVRNHADSFDYNVIYTNDKDLLINIGDKVGVMRFKQYKGYAQVDRNNYETYLEQEFKVFIPYNMLGLYLSSAGDSADKIKGIVKFGPKAFSKLMTKVAAKNKFDMGKCGDYDELQKVIYMCDEFLTPEQFERLKSSFALVANVELLEDVEAPVKVSTESLRTQAYEKFQFKSLI